MRDLNHELKTTGLDIISHVTLKIRLCTYNLSIINSRIYLTNSTLNISRLDHEFDYIQQSQP